MSRMNEQTTRLIRDELRTSASPADVYAAWADPERLAQWFVDAARGSAEPGGTMTWVWEAFGMEVTYEVVDAEPERRLVLRAPPGVAPPGLIELTIQREGGETVLTIVNSGFLDGAEWDDMYEGVRSGWTMALALLKEYLEHHAGRGKRTFAHMRPCDVDVDVLQLWFTDEERLRRWLTTSGAPRGTRAPFPLVLHDGTALEARMIARTESELALALRSEQAVLELKTFTMPPDAPEGEELPVHLRPGARAQRIVCVSGTSWHRDPARFAWLSELSAGALERLVAELSA
jgi:uncharacterized protein YndB with AHSA1/START domain